MTTSNQQSVMKIARAKLKQGKLADAVLLLQQHIDKNPDDMSATELLGMCHFTGKDFESAKTAFETVTRISSQMASAWINLGATQNVLEDFNSAAKSLRKALKCDRHSSSAYYNLGIAQKGLQMNPNAVSAYQEAIKLEPQLASAHANLANLFIEMKNNKQALRTLEAGLKECPEDRKLAFLLKKVNGLTNEAKRSAAPLGRLVDEDELAKKQIRTLKRDLTPKERESERVLLKTHSKEIRDRLPHFIALLEENLPRQIHSLHLAALQKADTSEAIESYEEMADTLDELKTWRTDSRECVAEIRTHLEQTDPGL